MADLVYGGSYRLGGHRYHKLIVPTVMRAQGLIKPATPDLFLRLIHAKRPTNC